MKWHHVGVIALKEWREIVRDPIYLALAFLIPAVMMFVLGSGMMLEVRHMPYGVWDMDNSAQSRDLTERFRHSVYFRYRSALDSYEAVEAALKRGEIRFALIIPPDYGERLARGHPAQIQTLIDGQFTYHARVAKAYVDTIVAHANQALALEWAAVRRGLSPAALERMMQPVRLEVRYLYNQALRSEWSMAPGLVMLIMLVSPALLTALGVVREKERGSIFNIQASTVSRAAFLLGKLLPYVLISMLNLVVLTLLALGYFGAPFKGSVLAYALASFIYIFAAGAIGLLVSVLVRSQAAAALITLLGTMIPGFMFSGLMMPISSMSPEAQVEAHVFPAMHFLEVVWGVYLKGYGLEALTRPIGLLALYALVLMGLAWLTFHKRVKR